MNIGDVVGVGDGVDGEGDVTDVGFRAPRSPKTIVTRAQPPTPTLGDVLRPPHQVQ